MSQGALSIAERLALRRGEVQASRSRGLRPYKLKAGKTLLRFLPQAGYPNNMAPGTMGIERRFGVTYLKSFDNKTVASIGDKEITYGQSDPFRDMIFEAMRQAPTAEVKKHYQDMLASARIILCALVLNDKDQKPDEPVLIEVSEGAFDEGILAQAAVWGDTGVDVFDPQDGHVYQVEKSGTGLDTTYVWAVTPSKAPVKQEILDKVIDLDAWLKSLFESKEQRAVEALQKLNAAAGLTVATPPQLTAGTPATPQAALPAPAGAPSTATAPQPTTPQPAPAAVEAPAMVTHAIEDAQYEEVAPATVPVAETPAPAAAPAVVETPAPTPAPAAVEPAAPAADGDLAAILASLN